MRESSKGVERQGEPQREFWMKQDFETECAYNAFAVYRDLGIRRRLRAAAGIFYGREDLGPTDAQYDQFKRWSRRNLWAARVEAFDAEEDRERMMRMKQRRIDMLETHFQIAQIGLQRVLRTLQAMGPEDVLPYSQIAPILREVTQLQRLTIGESTENVNMHQRHRDADGIGEEDRELVRGLSLEDQEELARLSELLDEQARHEEDGE